jgi:outer membrane protein assembly factor BamB
MSKKLFLVIGLVALIAMGANTAECQDWPMFHHDLAQSGVTSSDAPDDNSVLWQFQTGAAVEASPVMWNGIVFVGNTAGTFYALDWYTGGVLWSFNAGAQIYSTAAVAYGNVYVLDTSGQLHARDAMTGAPVWMVPGLGGPWSWSCPSVKDNQLFVAASNGNMHCFNATTGAPIWTTFVGGSPDGPIAVVNGKVYTGTHNFDNFSPTILALDETTGAILWTYDYYLYHGGVVGMVNSNGVSVADEDADGNLEVYFGVYNWQGVGPQAVCLNEVDGTERWAVSINGNSTSTPAVHNGNVFIGSDDGNVYALDAMTGGTVWSYATGGPVWAAPAVADGKVFVGSLDHIFYALDETDGSLVWSYNTGASRLESSPAIANGVVYVGNENGKVYAFGTPVVQVALDIKPTSCPNPLNVKSKGVLPVAILGTEDFDVMDIDPATILLEGVAPIRYNYEDVATPFEGELCDCHELGPDGYTDMTLKFRTQDIVAAIAVMSNKTAPVNSLHLGSWEMVELTLTGMTLEGQEIEGHDCVRVMWKDKNAETADEGEAGGVVVTDASIDVLYPSSFASGTQITFGLPEPTHVTLSVFDAAGRRVKTLVNEAMPGGIHSVSWNGRDNSGVRVPSGVYFIMMNAPGIEKAAKMVMVE